MQELNPCKQKRLYAWLV